MSKERIGSVLAAFESTIAANNAAGNTSGMYLSNRTKMGKRTPGVSNTKMELRPRIQKDTSKRSLLTKESSSRGLVKETSRRSLLTKESSNRSLVKETSKRNLLQKSGSNRNLLSGSVHGGRNSSHARSKDLNLGAQDKNKGSSVGTAETCTTLSSDEEKDVQRKTKSRTKEKANGSGYGKAKKKKTQKKRYGEEDSESENENESKSGKKQKKKYGEDISASEHDETEASFGVDDLFDFDDESTFADDANCSFTSNRGDDALDNFNSSFSMKEDQSKDAVSVPKTSHMRKVNSLGASMHSLLNADKSGQESNSSMDSFTSLASKASTRGGHRTTGGRSLRPSSSKSPKAEFDGHQSDSSIESFTSNANKASTRGGHRTTGGRSLRPSASKNPKAEFDGQQSDSSIDSFTSMASKASARPSPHRSGKGLQSSSTHEAKTSGAFYKSPTITKTRRERPVKSTKKLSALREKFNKGGENDLVRTCNRSRRGRDDGDASFNCSFNSSLTSLKLAPSNKDKETNPRRRRAPAAEKKDPEPEPEPERAPIKLRSADKNRKSGGRRRKTRRKVTRRPGAVDNESEVSESGGESERESVDPDHADSDSDDDAPAKIYSNKYF